MKCRFEANLFKKKKKERQKRKKARFRMSETKYGKQ